MTRYYLRSGHAKLAMKGGASPTVSVYPGSYVEIEDGEMLTGVGGMWSERQPRTLEPNPKAARAYTLTGDGALIAFVPSDDNGHHDAKRVPIGKGSLVMVRETADIAGCDGKWNAAKDGK